MSQAAPRTVLSFLTVFVLAMALYPVIALSVWDLIAGGGLQRPLLLIGAMLCAQLAAVILVWRRWRWARWLVILLLLLDIPMYMAALPGALFRNLAFPALSLLQFGLHFAAVFLLFTPSAAAWLGRTRPR